MLLLLSVICGEIRQFGVPQIKYSDDVVMADYPAQLSPKAGYLQIGLAWTYESFVLGLCIIKYEVDGAWRPSSWMLYHARLHIPSSLPRPIFDVKSSSMAAVSV